MNLKIVITDCSWGTIDVEKRFLPKGAIIKAYQCRDEDEVIRVCQDADAILSEYAPLNKRVLKSLARCKIISNSTIGVDNIDIKTAKELGISVANVPGYCSKDVADHTLALMLTSIRNIIGYDQEVRNNNWNINSMPSMRRLEGQVLGLIGFGEIAQNVAIRAQGFGMKVITYSSVPKDLTDAFKVERVELDQLLAEADIISCHKPLNDQTLEFINLELFQRMKKRPLFINTSRGKVIKETDLIEALERGYLGGAALDVLEEEPTDPSNKLLKMKNVILTPHVGFYSEEAVEEVRRRSALNITNYFKKNFDQVNFIE